MTAVLQPENCRLHVVLTVNAAWNLVHFRGGLIKGLLADGHRLTVFAPPDSSVPKLEAMGCRFVPLHMDPKGLNPWHGLRLYRTMARVFENEKPDAILSYTIKNNIFGAFAAGRRGYAFVPNVTGLGTAFLSGGLAHRLAGMLHRLAFRRLDVVFFQNPDDRDLFVSHGMVRARQARCLPGSGIDLSQHRVAPLPAIADRPVFLMIARLIRDKGVAEYVEAAKRVRKIVPTARFQLLGAKGKDNRGGISPATVAAWQAGGIIEVLGETGDVRPFIRSADCVVLPSYREGAPRTLLEAAAMARPVIATDVPGCRAVVDDMVSGLLCKVRSAESLADACLRFIFIAPADRVAMGLAGRAKMEREFDQALVLDAYRKVLSEIAGQLR